MTKAEARIDTLTKEIAFYKYAIDKLDMTIWELPYTENEKYSELSDMKLYAMIERETRQKEIDTILAKADKPKLINRIINRK